MFRPQMLRTAVLFYSTQVFPAKYFELCTLTLVLGGPGVSGIDLIRGAGQSFQTVLGEEYDIIGFDPRWV